MTAYTAPLREIEFLLHDVLRIAEQDIPGYAALDRDITAQIHAEAARLAETVLAPLNASGDAEGCRRDGATVTTPAGFTDAFRRLAEGGWISLDCAEPHGGQGMPYLLNCTTGEMFVAANMALNMYQGLTHAAISALQAHAAPELQDRYLPPLVAGRWAGTMNLTEAHCGTDLGLIRTRAEPQPDGSYRITGQKTWISGGEHDLTENIVHLVLARITGAPEGTRGLSLFVVPKRMPEAGGQPGAANGVTCTGLERKMGIHAAATCSMAYDGATGWLVGAENAGLKAMFTMMNEARLGVGLQGFAVASRAHQAAVAFARDRLQGRALDGPRNPDGPADPILVHPDVRRALMDQRAFVQGARALVFWVATLIDRGHRLPDPAAADMAALLTPVVKGFLTDKGFEACVSAQQVAGGAGYVHGTGFEQFTRDARIAMIYEGTNGVQALDLVARKLSMKGGKPMLTFFDLIRAETRNGTADPALAEGFVAPLKEAARDLQSATGVFMERGLKHPAEALSGAHDFLRLMGHVCLGLMWTRMARAAAQALAEGRGDPAFHRATLTTGRHYMRWALPETAVHLSRIRSGAETVMELAEEAF